MRILLINPNTTAEFTARIASGAQKVASPGTEIIALQPASGPRSIECVYDELLSAQGTLELAIAEQVGFDAIAIACYSDHPVIQALREITDKPVLGIAEASMYMACMIGRQFSVVTTNREWIPLLWDAVRHYGLESRCASVRAVDLPVLALHVGNEDQVYQMILQEAREAIVRDGAESICLGCAGMAGLDKQLEKEILVPVLDGVTCAVKLLEALVGCGLTTSKQRTYAQPSFKELVNLPATFSKIFKK